MATRTEPTAGETTGALFRALRSVGVEPDLAYSADDEVRSQAGQNVITVLDARFAELSAKIDSQATEIRSNRWMMGAVLALLATLTALGVFNTALGLVD
jgi:2-phosphoglycerate kinase